MSLTAFTTSTYQRWVIERLADKARVFQLADLLGPLGLIFAMRQIKIKT
jgi:hypothetical protein